MRGIDSGQATRNASPPFASNGVAIFDYDGDGRKDIFIANGTRLNGVGPQAPLPHPYHNGGNILYRNRGDGTFEDITQEAHFPVTGTPFYQEGMN
ncbi:MAG: VCBS repeat-containing protein, partial [Acidobacteriaceae bacterium]|nr:VCBS repeat-containing protein [Acidobacteriaceae bacterium]